MKIDDDGTKVVITVNGIKKFRTDITELLQDIQDGKEVHVTTYTRGRKPQSVIKLVKIQDLLDTATA
ncbi:MAG: hypothetical protein IZT57_03015 [Chloroflexi bacterium]|nr:hypothetical protein [Chloroflexota bacterium]